ncbi:MAG TPA: hypothetical protein VJU34_09000 [Phenylobacterium sp.]|nr:hypothetical protein [Phenylobacterium sp.]
MAGIDLVEHVLDEEADPRLVRLDPTGRVARPDQAPQMIVAWRVIGRQRAADPGGVLIDDVALRRGEGAPVHHRRFDIAVARDDPDVLVAELVDGRFVPQALEGREGIVDHGRIPGIVQLRRSGSGS